MPAPKIMLFLINSFRFMEDVSLFNLPCLGKVHKINLRNLGRDFVRNEDPPKKPKIPALLGTQQECRVILGAFLTE